MNATESIMLCRYVRAACPQQAMDEYTPEAWLDLLGDLRYEDCRLAAANMAKREPFVAPAEIRSEVKRIRRDRIEAGPAYIPSRPGMSELEQIAEQREHWRRIGDGLPGIEPAGELKPRPALGVLTRTIEDV